MWKQILLKKKNPARWIALIYVVFGVLWILFSDQAILMMELGQERLTVMQTYKGWFFVVGSGILIYTLMHQAIEDLRKVESSLREKELMQKTFLEKHYQPLWQTDANGYCIFSNEKWMEFTAYPLHKDKVFPWVELVHNDEKPLCISKFSEGLISQKPFTLEYRMLHKDGSYHWVINSCVPKFTSFGRFDGITAFIFDIHDKKVLEDRYKESSKRYGYLFLNNPHPMVVYDTQDFRILEVNKAALHQYGYTEKEFLSLTLLDLHPQDQIADFLSKLAIDIPDFFRSQGWKHIKKDNSVFDVEVITHTLPMNNHQNMRLVIINDITQQIKAFNTVKEGEHRFRMIFEHAPDGEIIFSDTLKMLSINPSACKMLGLRKETALNTTLFQFIADDSKALFNEAIKSLEKGKPVNGFANLMHTSGRKFRSQWFGVSFNEMGNVRYFFSFNDIDENQKMQDALLESQRMNATLISSLPGMAYRSLNNAKWTMLFVSRGVQKLTGYKEEDFLHSKVVSYAEIIHPEDKTVVIASVQESLQKKKPFELFYRIISKKGKIKWVWEHGQGVFSEKNELNYIEGFIIDITREKEASQQVEFQSYFLGLIIDNIPFPLFYKDIQGKYLGCNMAFCKYLGKTKQDLIGKTVFEILDKDQAQSFHDRDQELLATGDSQSYETEITFPDNNKLNVVFHKSVFYNLENKPLGIVGVYFDITERVKAERIIKQQLHEMARINSELERFTYTVSHDLRSPLVTIKGFLGLLKEDMEEQNHEQVKDDLRRIDDATDKMQQLLEGLLELSRLGRVVKPFEVIHLSQVANEAKELLFGVIKDRNYQIIIQDNMPMVYGDRALLRELFQNLIENAIKFTYKNANPKISVYVRRADDLHVICVEDNGVGIKPKYQKKIFGLFNKLDGNTPGTGIGLSLVKRIVETHQGKIWVESEGEGLGAVFCFTLNTEKTIS